MSEVVKQYGLKALVYVAVYLSRLLALAKEPEPEADPRVVLWCYACGQMLPRRRFAGHTPDGSQNGPTCRGAK